jgi:MFS family permease
MQVATIGGALLGTFPAGILADRGSKKRVVYISCAFSAVAMAAFGVAQTPIIAVITAVLFGVGYGAFCAVDWAFACNLLPEGSPAKFMAIWSLSDTIPQVLAPAFGPIADNINKNMGIGDGWRAALLLGSVCIIGGAFVIRIVHERVNLPTDLSAQLIPIVLIIFLLS